MTSREEREWWPRLKAREIIKNLKISDPSELVIEDIAWTQGALVKEGGLCGCDARLRRVTWNGMRRRYLLVCMLHITSIPKSRGVWGTEAYELF